MGSVVRERIWGNSISVRNGMERKVLLPHAKSRIPNYNGVDKDWHLAKIQSDTRPRCLLLRSEAPELFCHHTIWFNVRKVRNVSGDFQDFSPPPLLFEGVLILRSSRIYISLMLVIYIGLSHTYLHSADAVLRLKVLVCRTQVISLELLFCLLCRCLIYSIRSKIYILKITAA